MDTVSDADLGNYRHDSGASDFPENTPAPDSAGFVWIFAGMAYSWLMDIWTAISWYGSFTWEGYRAALISAIPVVVVYCISNVIFLMILLKPIGEKLERIQIKHGIF